MERVKLPIIFLACSGFLWIAMLIPTLALPKSESFIFFQLPHNSASTHFANVFTELGNGLTLALIAIGIAIFKKLKWGIILFLGFSISGIGVQVVKRTVFKEEARPVAWFENKQIDLEVPEHINPRRRFSFPSGHSTTAAVLFTFLAFRMNKRWGQIVLSILLFSVAYSRIYLFQHFPVDVLAGIGIGISFQCLLEYSLGNKMKSPVYQKSIKK